MSEQQSHGSRNPRHFDVLAFRCDAAGIVEEIVADDLGLNCPLAAGQSMLSIIDPPSHQKAMQFLDTVVARRAASGWELTVVSDSRPFAAVFSGAMQKERLFIVVGRSARDITDVVETLEQINNEQLNNFRMAFRDQHDSFDRRVRTDAQAYEQLSRLNNELSNTQRELAAKSTELTRLNEEKNRFLGMAAHDLRNPLTVILGYANYLTMDGVESDPEKKRMYTEIEGSSRFMLDLINDLLDVSRIESGRREVEISTFDAADLMNQRARVFLPFAAAKKIELRVQTTGPVMMTSDAGKLRQIVSNLIGNAIKYSNADTTIDVTLRVEGAHLLIDVKDQGIGIPSDQLEKIFQPFVRLGKSGTAGERSTGLGLSIVAELVSVIGGRIRVESEFGVGSTFHVTVPLVVSGGSVLRTQE